MFLLFINKQCKDIYKPSLQQVSKKSYINNISKLFILRISKKK
nr:MAG TPA: hypothetical protein [Crassvirales sp.]